MIALYITYTRSLRASYEKEVVVIRNDKASPEHVSKLDPDAIIISPGPGNPEKIEDIGYSRAVVEEFKEEKPILGICLGHQVIGLAMGAKVRKARSIFHGKVSLVKHFGGPLYKEIPEVFKAMRYHSYVIYDPPEYLVVDAISLDDGEIMGVHHRSYPLIGVQYTPRALEQNLGGRF